MGSRNAVRDVELLEPRELLATFTVTNLSSSGTGSLRQAIQDANDLVGANTIDFNVAGTINVGATPLPTLQNAITLDGTSAPNYNGAPVVTLNFQGTRGLVVGAQGGNTTIKGLSIVGADSAGIILLGPNVTVQGNYIGVAANGSTVNGNHGDGIAIQATSTGDVIGNPDPIQSVSYYPSTAVPVQPVSGWQGIRAGDTTGQYIMTGTSNSDGLLFEGTIAGVGKAYKVDFPGAQTTSVYGPNNLGNGTLQLVGTYQNPNSDTSSVAVNGFYFMGTTADLSNALDYRTVDYPGAKYTFVHSTAGFMAVGNADSPTSGGQALGPGTAFLYDVHKGTFTNIVYPGSTSNTAYGIWSNGGTSYTIVGGYSTQSTNNASNQNQPIGQAYMVDYDSATGQFTHWTSFNYLNGTVGTNFVTHFQGVSSVEKGVYTLSADSVQAGTSNPVQGSWVTVRRNTDGSFGPAIWVNLNAPNNPGVVSNDSVTGDAVVGFIMGPDSMTSVQATLNMGFQASNVISGNAGNGIGIYGSNNDRISMNNIGTDVTGTVKRPNALNGIYITGGAKNDFIGGQATNGNNPTNNVFARPPMGNLISGNGQNGVLINAGSTGNTLSGNFIGTAASGNSPLGNTLDGVAIENANGNSLIGCTFQQNPFVFYNVISGNGGNGLRITNSNNTTVQANFIGVGANNATVVGNGYDGLVITGTSANTQVGGVIPLGNVISGNAANGIEVRDQASGFISFNTFGGVYAFGGAAPNGNDGILITATGGNNVVRTSIIGGNAGNGIEIGGNATGVQVTDTGAGTDTALNAPIPNQKNGILIDGAAHDNVIGGFQKSVEPQVTASGNVGYGIVIANRANHNRIFGSSIGVTGENNATLPNGAGGILLGPGTSDNIIGGVDSQLQNRIAANVGNGLTINGSNGNIVLGNQIVGNTNAGVLIAAASGNVIGAAGSGNNISANGGIGLGASGNVAGTQVQSNVINKNAKGGVNFTSASGQASVQRNSISNNTGNGVSIVRTKDLTVGGALGTGNQILSNSAIGVFASGVCTGSSVVKNTVAHNKQNVNVASASGLKYVP